MQNSYYPTPEHFIALIFDAGFQASSTAHDRTGGWRAGYFILCLHRVHNGLATLRKNECLRQVRIETLLPNAGVPSRILCALVLRSTQAGRLVSGLVPDLVPVSLGYQSRIILHQFRCPPGRTFDAVRSVRPILAITLVGIILTRCRARITLATSIHHALNQTVSFPRSACVDAWS
jgi:hypothetical protein